jgi:L,D-peptidoglycan transpeptidase YkuD (ErfK/YbiS/YcfS/YnhG family)
MAIFAVLLSACGSAGLNARASVQTTRPLAPSSTVLAITLPSTTLLAPPTIAPTTVAPRATRVATTAPSCSPNVAGQLSSTREAAQLIVVDATTAATTDADLSAFELQGSCWVPVFGPWTARIGAAGFSDHHVEGDNTTPTGDYSIGPVMYGNAANPGVRYPYHQLVCGDWWDEDPSSPQYNTFQHVPCGETPPFGGDSEALWEETTAYPSFAMVDYNTSPAVPGAGSAIFLHADVGAPTAGCVSLPLDELDDLLTWLLPADNPLIVLGSDSEITKF